MRATRHGGDAAALSGLTAAVGAADAVALAGAGAVLWRRRARGGKGGTAASQWRTYCRAIGLAAWPVRLAPGLPRLCRAQRRRHSRKDGSWRRCWCRRRRRTRRRRRCVWSWPQRAVVCWRRAVASRRRRRRLAALRGPRRRLGGCGRRALGGQRALRCRLPLLRRLAARRLGRRARVGGYGHRHHQPH